LLQCDECRDAVRSERLHVLVGRLLHAPRRDGRTDSAKEKPQEEEIVAVGWGKMLENGSGRSELCFPLCSPRAVHTAVP
jgi:hypothetical protein